MPNKNQDYLDQLRHSAAHLLAAAVLQIWPDTKPTIGPSIEDGFYYDFDFATPISERDLPKIEEKMRELVKNWQGFERIEVNKEDALDRYRTNNYKQELIQEFSEEGKTLTLYKSGEFTDLCRGGHIEHPAGELLHFKLLSVAGAYWRGSEKNPMLTRIYGTAFPSQDDLDEYLRLQDEARRRDHKVLGPQLDLFTFSELVGSGLPLWTPKGTLLRNELDNFVWELRRAKGYEKVEIPHITKKDLYERSGHWDKFKDELFKIVTREGHEFAMKPMNCPHHTQIYARKQHSYRDLPQRYATTTMVYRDEQSGELAGLSRVRAITQDDAHVFCRRSQIKEEMFKIWDIIEAFYAPVGFELQLRISLSDPNEPEKYLGRREDWDVSEQILREMATERKVTAIEAEGEAAFYGPKLDFMAHDALGREWQVATIQLDMNMPERFDLYCINEEGEKERIVMIHAAIMGSIERYLSILIEHYGGAFPTWLSPVQVKVLPISDKHLEYAHQVASQMQDAGLRVEVDNRSERLSAKIRDAQLEKAPYMAVVGDKEAEQKSVAVRERSGGKQEAMGLKEFIDLLQAQVRERRN